MKMNLEKFKSDKKFRNTVLCSVIGLILVIAVSVAVPIGVHNSNIKKATISEQAASTESETINEIETEPESETTSAEVAEQETTEATTVEASKVSPPNTNKSNSSDKSSPAKEKPTQKQSGSKSNTKPKQETVTTLSQTTEHVWTQAEVDAIVTEIKQYAINKGFRIDDSMTTQGTSWNNPANTSRYSWAGDKAVSKVKSYLKEEIEWNYNDVLNEVGYFPENVIGINIVVQTCYGTYGETAWEIYVVY